MKIFKKREEEVISEIRNLLELLCTSCENLRKMLIEKKVGEISRIERDADELRRNIIKNLSEAFLPYLRPYIYELVDTIDDAIDSAKDSEESFRRLIKRDKNLVENFMDELVEIVEINFKMSQILKSCTATLFRGIVSREEALAILFLEKKVDDIKSFVLDEISKMEADFWTIKFFLDFFENLTKISDHIEKACDVVQIISLSL